MVDQIQREKVLEKLGKLKALAERGVGGEKETALRKYEELCAKYDISDLEAEEALQKIEKHWFGYKTELEEELLIQIFYKVTGSAKYYTYRGEYKRRKKRGVECTPIEAAEIDLLFSFYRKQMEEELKVFMIAFKNKNDLYPDENARRYTESNEPQRELTEEELQRYRKAAYMKEFMDKKEPPRAAIEEFRLYGYGKYKEGVGTLRATRGDCGGSETLIVEKGSLYHARRQTPTECERLNGFPDGWTKYDTKNKEISDAARYTALGNSIAIPCAERVFMGICRAEEQEVRQMDIDREAETDGLTVLSLFDGISCGRIALERAGIKVKKYYASEIKKAAMDVTMEHYPDTIQIGDVKNVWYNNGTLYTENGTFEVGKIDLLIGGSPCQDFSVARVSMGTKTIDGLNGEKSSLFYEYLRLKRMVNPSFFLLENVKMKKDSEHELNKYMGVDGIHINSSLVSFQTRERIYWSNIKGIEPPEDRKISFQDHKDTEAEYCRQFKVKRTKSRERMWNNGRGRETSLNCTNITHAEKVGCITRKQDRCPNSGLIEFEDFCRYLTRREIEKAQTLPVGYTDNLTYGQMQDVCGDGWTVDVVAHIFGFLRKEVESGGK